MKKQFIVCVTLLLLLGGITLIQAVNAAPKKGTLRVSGDNTWTIFINGERVNAHIHWNQPTVDEFELDKGFAVIAIYVHDAEPGAAGRGGFLADIILDDEPEYIGTGEDGWRCEAGKPIAQRNDGWEKVDFDDSEWEDELEIMDKFGGGIWGGGAAAMRNILKDPDCTANWVWCGPNDGEDDIYFRYTIGELPVEPKDKLATSWAKIKGNTM
ncbi:MAG: hypothetical protein OXI43_21860 [Candidatus Poribacteria bacterium]|nr:hypothetical protein [Candidatus Poribacteria bacterium]